MENQSFCLHPNSQGYFFCTVLPGTCISYLLPHSRRRRSNLGNLELTTILEWLWKATPVVLGAAGGYLFYRFVGCKTGSCPITGSPWLSTIGWSAPGLPFAAGWKGQESALEVLTEPVVQEADSK